MESKTCPICNKEFKQLTSQHITNTHKWSLVAFKEQYPYISLGGDTGVISKAIAAKSMENYSKNPSVCDHCKSPLDYKHRHNKFCNRSCAASFNNKNRNVKTNICKSCGKEIKSNKVYCNNKCQQEFKYNDRVNKFINGEISTLGVTWRRFLTEKDGYQCNSCGISEWNGTPIVLEIEHIDGNSSNNSIDNLCFLCPNCHSQTSTYKNRNKGNGRHYRRIRYSEGKSY